VKSWTRLRPQAFHDFEGIASGPSARAIPAPPVSDRGYR
jgi:hypothetical protein